MVDAWEFERRVKEFMKTEKMAEHGDGILAAVSGGADSVCLLFLLNKWREELGIRLAAFHLNHGIRGGEADRDEAYVKELCGQLGVPVLAAHEDVSGYAACHKISEEEAGRELRYLHLERAAKELSFQKIATAHHKDDNAETVLLNLFRGSGLKGLSGIRPVRGDVIRPLLCVTRKEIVEYLTENGIWWCEDSTNKECVYARNKVRNELFPWIKENINDRAGEHLLNLAELAGQADEYFTRQAEMLLSEGGTSIDAEVFDRQPEIVKGYVVRMMQAEMLLSEGGTSIDAEVFDGQPEILKGYVVRMMAARAAGSPKDLSLKHVKAVCGLTGPGGGTEVRLSGGLYALRGYRTLEIRKGTDVQTAPHLDIHPATRVFSWKKDQEIPKNQYTKWFDYDKIKGTLSFRSRESGDYLTIGGGKRKLLKRFFIDEKIPESERDSVCLLAEGNHVLWVIGYRISEYYKITENTRTILEVTICKGEENG